MLGGDIGEDLEGNNGEVGDTGMLCNHYCTMKKIMIAAAV